MKNVKQGLIFSAIALFSLSGLNSCLGDKGNMTTS